MHAGQAIVGLACLGVLLAGCDPAPPAPVVEEIEVPAPPGAALGNLHADRSGRLVLTWVESEPEAGLARLRLSVREADRWSAPRTVAEGSGWFVNWADFPALYDAGPFWVTHWLEKVADSTYAYAVRLALSTDRGVSWTEPLTPHDASPTEHGFVSYFPDSDGAGVVWLDGRETAGGGPMTLRTARVTADLQLEANTLLDDRVCDCCQTDAAGTAAGPVVVYRDRRDDEVRDIYMLRRDDRGWSEPRRVAADDWHIAACPVNGPAVAASGHDLAVAWYSGAEGPRVSVVRSADAGETFGDPVTVDATRPLGRIDAAWLGDGRLAVSYVDQIDAESAMVRVAVLGAGEPQISDVGTTDPARSSGFPRLAVNAAGLWIVWREIGPGTDRLHVGRLSGH